jgi:predicted AAA+ superfamily ATPase
LTATVLRLAGGFPVVVVTDPRQSGKTTWNQGMPSNLHFWRDSTGNEVDLLRDQSVVLWPMEIKSGQTVAGDMLRGLLKWRDLADAPTGDPWRVFGGEGDHLRRDVRVMGWRALLRHI